MIKKHLLRQECLIDIQKIARQVSLSDFKSAIAFLTSSENDIDFLTDTIGYEYRYDAESGEYFHPSFIYVVSDQGKIVDGLKFGSISSDIYDIIASAKENTARMSFEQFYSFTCLQQDIENRNPQNAFDFVQFAGVWFLLSSSFFRGACMHRIPTARVDLDRCCTDTVVAQPPVAARRF